MHLQSSFIYKMIPMYLWNHMNSKCKGYIFPVSKDNFSSCVNLLLAFPCHYTVCARDCWLFIPYLSSSPFSYRALILLKVAIYSAKLLHFLASVTSEMKDLSERHWVGLSRELLFYLSLFLPLLLIAINNVFLMSELQQSPLELEHKAMLSKEQQKKGMEPPCSPWVLTS